MYGYVPLLTQGFQCVGWTPPPNISQNTPPASQEKDKIGVDFFRLQHSGGRWGGGESNFPYILLNEIQTMFSQLAKLVSGYASCACANVAYSNGTRTLKGTIYMAAKGGGFGFVLSPKGQSIRELPKRFR